MVSIELSNVIKSFQIDVLGRGSVIGVNNIISGEEWVYQAKAASSQTVLLLQVSRVTLLEKAAEFKQLNSQLEIFKEMQEQQGLPQIDYLIRYHKIKQKEIEQKIVLDFSRTNLWKQNKPD